MRAVIDIRGVPADVRAAVQADAANRGVSLTDVVGEVVAGRYGVRWEPSGYPNVGGGDTDHWNLRVPVVLRDALKATAEAIGGTITGCLILALQQHYGLATTAPTRRTGRPGLDPEVVKTARQRHDAGESLRSLSAEYGVKRETLTKAIRGGVAA